MAHPQHTPTTMEASFKVNLSYLALLSFLSVDNPLDVAVLRVRYVLGPDGRDESQPEAYY